MILWATLEKYYNPKGHIKTVYLHIRFVANKKFNLEYKFNRKMNFIIEIFLK